MQLSNASLLIFQYSLDDKDVHLQFEDQKVNFLLKNKLTLQPGQIKELNLNFVTNTQVVPELSSDLDESIAVGPNLQFAPQLCIGVINIANCSDDVLKLHPSSNLLTLTFSSEQIFGIKRELESILNNQQMDRNIVNYQFLKSTAQTISKIATQAYIKDLTSYRAQTEKNEKKS